MVLAGELAGATPIIQTHLQMRIVYNRNASGLRSLISPKHLVIHIYLREFLYPLRPPLPVCKFIEFGL